MLNIFIVFGIALFVSLFFMITLHFAKYKKKGCSCHEGHRGPGCRQVDSH